MDNFEFANRIAELRKQKGLSQKQLGDMLGVSNKAVSKWENGESLPKMSTMLSLAEILGVDGNELIGLGNTSSVNDGELDRLKGENARLSSKLDNIEKSRKRALIMVVALCVVGIIAGVVIALCSGIDTGMNSDIEDAGKEGTKIVFSNTTFVVADDFQKCFIKQMKNDYSTFDFEKEVKYADYYNKSGETQKAAIYCAKSFCYVVLPVGEKNYYYIDEKISADEINKDRVFFIDLQPNYAAYDKVDGTTDFICESYNADYPDGEKFIAEFCEFYANKGKPVDKKIIQYYGGKGISLASVSFTSESQISILEFDAGEFFVDDDRNVYFYDYVTSSAYPVGKELSKYVVQTEKVD
ncbi:MAG: helix-turn-helix transcriptional regulator [Eubacteriales bacterium]|nr:helix-turn-helix transcriptional regulator [Eubacteriales bacterium]